MRCITGIIVAVGVDDGYDCYTGLMRLLRKAGRNARVVRKFVHGLVDTDHPLLVHIVPMRRCNIDCGYCNEFDKVSQPVPLEVMEKRVAKLTSLGASVIAFSGGEPMLHPQLDDIIRAIRRNGALAGL